MKIRKLIRGNSGQALVETLLMLPILLMLVLNAINFAYFFLMALNISASSRSSGIYSIMGGATPANIGLPAAAPMDCSTSSTTKSVSAIACQDLVGAVYTPSAADTGVQVCSPKVGVLNPGTRNEQSACTSFGFTSNFPAAEPDPELNSDGTSRAFLLNRVDVAYRFTTPIPLMPFNIVVLAAPACTGSAPVTCTFYRHIEMRAMN